MSLSPARSAAFQVLLRVDHDQAFAPELLHSERYAKLSPQDHGLLTELVMGVLRWRSLLDNWLSDSSKRPITSLDAEVQSALRMGVYQLRFLDRIPARAAINESVELVKRARKTSAAAFVNAVLRKIDADPGERNYWEAIEKAGTVSELARAGSHPEWLVERWFKSFGLQDAKRICAYDQHRPGVAVRLPDVSTENELRECEVELAPGLLLSSARRVISGDVTRAQPFLNGQVAIEDEGSQLVGLLVGFGKRILDCCAAPGGKTRILAQRNPQAEVVAVELHPHRAELLRRLVKEQHVQVIAGDVRALSETGAFDRILVDAPCSGTGTLARNPEIKWRLRPSDVQDLQQRQLSILQSALAKLEHGGRLVYATCSLEPEENEEVIARALAQNSFRVVDVLPELDWLRSRGEITWAEPASLVRGPYLRTLPGLHPCDGFFAAILQHSTVNR
jgi:16S rRNA (cytosine967-C5)-methyltransferase